MPSLRCVHVFFILFVFASSAPPETPPEPTGYDSSNVPCEDESALHPGSGHGPEHKPCETEVRIVGGQDTPIEKIPFQASLQQYWRHICGAVVVSESWLVTAAHCVVMVEKGPSWSNTIRTETSWNIPFGWFGQRHNIAEMQKHPGYPGISVDYDIGVIRIDGIFKFGAKIQPIKIPTEGESYIKYDQPATVSGWGRLKEGAYFFSLYLQRVDIPIIPRPKCQEIYQNNTKYRVSERMLCAAGIAKGSPCQGDSGGPLVLRGQVIGLVSWGMKCNDDKFPSVFTNLLNTEVRNYIHGKTGV